MTIIKFVEGKNKHQSNCICIHNIDITSGGCPVGLSKESFDKNDACTYCYAKYVHKNYVKEKSIDEKEWIKLSSNFKVNVIRIGKNLEPGHINHRDILKNVLLLNNKYNFKTILITKLLNYDQEIADLLKVHNSTIHFSMGRESMEPGAVKLGATNAFRLESATNYFKNNTNVYLRIVEDITMGMRDEVKEWTKSGIPILVTPLRYPSKETLKQYRPNDDWDSLKSSQNFEFSGGYLKPVKWHPDYAKYRERCGIVDGVNWCNNCGLRSIKNGKE